MAFKIEGFDPETSTHSDIEIEGHTNALSSMTFPHVQTHRGNSFVSSDNTPTVTSGGGTYEILLEVGADTHAHLRNFVMTVTTAPGEVQLFEGTDASTGSELSTTNADRSSSNSTNLTVSQGPSITSDGTQLKYDQITGAKKSGGSTEEVIQEWILDSDTNYLIRYTNTSTNDAEAGFTLFWYEH